MGRTGVGGGSQRGHLAGYSAARTPAARCRGALAAHLPLGCYFSRSKPENVVSNMNLVLSKRLLVCLREHQIRRLYGGFSPGRHSQAGNEAPPRMPDFFGLRGGM